MKKALSYFIILCIGVYGIQLAINEQIGLYINIRYETLFIASSIICTLIGVIGIELFVSGKITSKTNGEKFNLYTLLSYIPIITMLGFAFLLPPALLSTRSSQILLDNSSTYQKQFSDSGIINFLKLGSDSKKYTPGDWQYIRNLDPKFQFQKGREINFSGYILKPVGTPEDVFFVARYFMTCCAVDAIQFGFPVQSSSFAQLEEKTWVDVIGKLILIKRKGINHLIIVPEKVTQIPQPHDPYVYY